MNFANISWYGFGFICGVGIGYGLTKRYYWEKLTQNSRKTK